MESGAAARAESEAGQRGGDSILSVAFDLHPAVVILPDERRVEGVRVYAQRGRMVAIGEDGEVRVRARVRDVRRSQANRRRWELETEEGEIIQVRKAAAAGGCSCRNPLAKLSRRTIVTALDQAGEEVTGVWARVG